MFLHLCGCNKVVYLFFTSAAQSTLSLLAPINQPILILCLLLSTVSSHAMLLKYMVLRAVEKKKDNLAHEHEIFVPHDASDRPRQHLIS